METPVCIANLCNSQKMFPFPGEVGPGVHWKLGRLLDIKMCKNLVRQALLTVPTPCILETLAQRALETFAIGPGIT